MKYITTLLSFILFIGHHTLAQTDGLNYQAVIIDPDPEEIPGIDVTGNIFSRRNFFKIINWSYFNCNHSNVFYNRHDGSCRMV